MKLIDSHTIRIHKLSCIDTSDRFLVDAFFRLEKLECMPGISNFLYSGHKCLCLPRPDIYEKCSGITGSNQIGESIDIKHFTNALDACEKLIRNIWCNYFLNDACFKIDIV